MNEPQCKTIAECYRAWATVLELAEKHGLDTINGWKYGDKTFLYSPVFSTYPEKYAFAVAVVEGKWVFIDDELWSNALKKLIKVVWAYKKGDVLCGIGTQYCCTDSLTWTIPKQEPEIQEGFTKWEGGECPINGNDRVEVLFRKGNKFTCVASDLRWNHFNIGDYTDPEADIIAYRIIKQYTTICGVKLPMPSGEGDYKVAGKYMARQDAEAWDKFVKDCLDGKIHD